MGRHSVVAVAAFFTGLLLAGAASAQAGGQGTPGTAVPKAAQSAPAAKAPAEPPKAPPGKVTGNFGQWSLICTEPKTKEEKPSCSLVQALVERDTNKRVSWIWDGANYCPGAWVVPKGNPAGAKVQQFIASTLKPERQIVLLDKLGNSPSNPAASALLTPEQQRIDPGFPANLAKQIIRDETWYADHYDDALNKWIDAIAS